MKEWFLTGGAFGSMKHFEERGRNSFDGRAENLDTCRG
jgi:hypothetical protein